ncbi:hypothetical protein ACOSP7_015885 [Xanthoceras sorbifolium]|uniref:Uncharacterized protein n=1 Tax=Xanthoceras sorbifolium TaxID=99658 RepID=A0ABQ8I7Q8_9ROSI|nr:hypothetical protein JRO89_XS04G0288000 [Xanthoceras sorbifolium]
MGNCIHVLSDESHHQKVRVVTLDGREKQFKASTPIKRITSGRYSGYKLVHQSQPYMPLPLDTKLEPGEAYYLVPNPSVSLKKAGQESCKRQRVKIVITRQQLELLLRNANKFQSARFSECFKDDFRKWEPSLASIPEVHNF